MLRLIVCIVMVTASIAIGESPLAGRITAGDLVLDVRQEQTSVIVTMADATGTQYANAAAVYELDIADGRKLALVPRIAEARERQVSIIAESGGLKLTHRLEIRPDGNGLTEQIQIQNTSSQPMDIRDYRFSLKRTASAPGELRVVAVPFRRNADGKLRDWSMDEIAAGKATNSDWRNDAAAEVLELVDSACGRLRAEGWVLTDGHKGLLIAKYNPDHIEYSMIGWDKGPNAGLLFGGSSFALHREPEAMQRLAPGGTVTLGKTYYLPVNGGWPAGYDRFRQLLNELGHGLPDSYNPPINWNELFDVGWYHSDPAALARHYTRDALLREAAKAAEIGATMLYLDPGWEVCEGTTLWDESRLGTVKDLVKTLREHYGLDLAFRTIGRVYRDEFPNQWYIQRSPTTRPYERPSADRPPPSEPVPQSDERGARNLALAAGATARSSSCLAGYAIHKTEYLNDGWYGNTASWISAGEPSWVEIDLGETYRIDRIRFGSEHSPWYRDRTPVHVRVLLAVQHAEDSADPRWKLVAENTVDPIGTTRAFAFAPQDARWIRLDILTSAGGAARIDEIEVYEAEPHPWQDKPRQRQLDPAVAQGSPIAFWEVCTQHPGWQREKLARLEKIASQGMKFIMFDEFDWRNRCYAQDHGHAVPSTPEDHVRAIYGLIRDLKQRVPGLLVEAHDPVWPWGVRYLPIYFEQTLNPSVRPGSYDENWGFEFMWDPINDLISGRALCLYYYNLGCDIPLYDHITMENDNDACLAFWWYASTVRHLGIGGKKGLGGKEENPTRWSAWKQAMSRYRQLRDWFVRGRFAGIDELTHLHTLPDRPGGVLLAFNLEERPVQRQVTLDASLLRLPTLPRLQEAAVAMEGKNVRLTFTVPARSPRIFDLTATD